MTLENVFSDRDVASKGRIVIEVGDRGFNDAESDGRIEKVDGGWALAEPRTAEDAMHAIAEWYHAQIDRTIEDHTESGTHPERPETAREYWQDVRGFSNETIEDKLLGWAPPDSMKELLGHLKDEGFSSDAITGTGLFTHHEEYGWSILYNARYVIPYLNEDGKAVYSIARATGAKGGRDYDGHPADFISGKYAKHKGNAELSEPIYGVDSVDECEDTLIAVGGILDAVRLHEAGYAAVSPVTTVQFKNNDKDALLELTEDNGVDELVMLNDAERPTSNTREHEDPETIGDALNISEVSEGLGGAFENIRWLEDHDLDATLATIPLGGVDLDKVDPDDMVRHSIASVDTVLAAAKPGVEHRQYTSWKSGKSSTKTPEFNPTEIESEDGSALFDLKLTDIIGMEAGERGVNPLGHHGNAGGYFMVGEDGEIGHDFKYQTTYNALTMLLCMADGRDADEPEGSMTGLELGEAWAEAKRLGVIPESDPLPRTALVELAIASGECERDNIEDGFVDSREAYNAAVESVEDTYGVKPGRSTLGSSSSGPTEHEEENPPVVPGFRPGKVSDYFMVPDEEYSPYDEVRGLIDHGLSGVVYGPVNGGKTGNAILAAIEAGVDLSVAIDNGRAGGMYDEFADRMSQLGANNPVVAQSYEYDSPLADPHDPYFLMEHTIDQNILAGLRNCGASPRQLYNAARNWAKYGELDLTDPGMENVDEEYTNQSEITEWFEAAQNEGPRLLPEDDEYVRKRSMVGETDAVVGHAAHTHMKAFCEDRAVILDDVTLSGLRTEATFKPGTDEGDSLEPLEAILEHVGLDVNPLDMTQEEAVDVFGAIYEKTGANLIRDCDEATESAREFLLALAFDVAQNGEYAEWAGRGSINVGTVTDVPDQHGQKTVKVKIWSAPKPLNKARSVIVLTATPFAEGWGRLFDALDIEMNIRAPAENDYQKGIGDQFDHIVQTSNYLHPGHGDNAPSPDRALEMLERFEDRYGHKPLLISTKSHIKKIIEKHGEEAVRSRTCDLPAHAEPQDDLPNGCLNFARAIASNDYGSVEGVVVATAPVPSHDEIAHYVRLCGGSPAWDGGKLDTSSGLEKKAYEHLVHDMVYQAMGRVARFDEAENGVAWIDTCAIPSWIPRDKPAEGRNDALTPAHWVEALEAAEDSEDKVETIMEVADVKERQAYNILGANRMEVEECAGEDNTLYNSLHFVSLEAIDSPAAFNVLPEAGKLHTDGTYTFIEPGEPTAYDSKLAAFGATTIEDALELSDMLHAL